MQDKLYWKIHQDNFTVVTIEWVKIDYLIKRYEKAIHSDTTITPIRVIVFN